MKPRELIGTIPVVSPLAGATGLAAEPDSHRPNIVWIMGPRAAVCAWKYEREFAHASVFVDLEKKTATIDWK